MVCQASRRQTRIGGLLAFEINYPHLVWPDNIFITSGFDSSIFKSTWCLLCWPVPESEHFLHDSDFAIDFYHSCYLHIRQLHNILRWMRIKLSSCVSWNVWSQVISAWLRLCCQPGSLVNFLVKFSEQL